MSGRLPSGNVYALYRQILEASFPHTYSLERFSIIVAAIVVLQRNLTPVELSQLLGIELNAINAIRKGLRTVLGDTEEVRFRHQSFVDFLVGGAEQMNDLALNDLTACPERFHIDVSDAHAHVCGSLFRLMHKDLHFNICSMPSSFLRNDELPQSHFENSIGRTLVYACQFWGLHLSNTQTDLEFDLINTFIREDFLSWIECLSVLRSLIVAVPALTSLEKQILSAPEQVGIHNSNLNPLLTHVISILLSKNSLKTQSNSSNTPRKQSLQALHMSTRPLSPLRRSCPRLLDSMLLNLKIF